MQGSTPVAVRGVPKAKKFDRIEPEEGITKEIEGEPAYAKWNKRNLSTNPVDEKVVSKNKKFDEEQINPTEKEGLTITSTNKTFGPVTVQENTPVAVRGVPKAKKFDRIIPDETTKEQIEGEPVYAKWNKRNLSTNPVDEKVVSKNKKFDEEQINPADKEGLTITSTNKTFGPITVQENTPLAVRGVPKAKKFDRIVPEEGVEETVISKNKKFDVERINPADKEGLTITSTNKTFGPVEMQATKPLDVRGVAKAKKFDVLEPKEGIEETLVSKNKKFDEELINPAEKEGLTITSTNKTFGPVEMQGSSPFAVRGVVKAKKFDRIEPEEGIEETVVSKNKKFDVERINPTEKEGITITSHHKTFDPVSIEENTPLAVRGIPKAKKFDRIEPEEGIEETVVSKNKKFDEEQINPADKEGLTITSTNKTFGPVEMQGSTPIAVRGVPKAKKFDRIEPEEGITKEIEGEPAYTKWIKKITNAKPVDETVVSKNKKFDEEQINPADKEGLTITSHHKTFDPVEVQSSNPIAVRGVPKAKKFDRIEPEEGITKQIEGEPAYAKWNKIIEKEKPIKGELDGTPIAVRWNQSNITETPLQDSLSYANKHFTTINKDTTESVQVQGVSKPKRFDVLQPNEANTAQIEGEPVYIKWNKRNASAKPIDDTTLISENKRFNIEQITPIDKNVLTLSSHNKCFSEIGVQDNSSLVLQGNPKHFSVLEKDNKVTTEAIEGEPTYKRWNIQNKRSSALAPSTVTSEVKRFKEEEITKEENDNVTVNAIKKELALSMEQIDHKLSGNTTKQYYKEKIIPIWQEETEVNPLKEVVDSVRYVRAAAPKREEPKSFTALQPSTPSINEFKGTSQSEKWMKAVKPDNRESDVNLDGNVSNDYYKRKVLPIWTVENRVKNNEDVGVKGNPQKKSFSKLEKSSTPASSINAGPRKWKRSNELSNKLTQEYLGLPKKEGNWRTSLSPDKPLSETFGPNGKREVIQYEEEDEIIVDDAEQYEIEDDKQEQDLRQRNIVMKVKKYEQEEQKQPTEEEEEIDVLSSISMNKSKNDRLKGLLESMKQKTVTNNIQPKTINDGRQNNEGNESRATVPHGTRYSNPNRVSDEIIFSYKGQDYTNNQRNPYFEGYSVKKYKKSIKKNNDDESEYYRDFTDDYYEK